MRDRTNYMSGSVPWDLENKFGESKLQDREIISVILATADAYLNAEVWNVKIVQMPTIGSRVILATKAIAYISVYTLCYIVLPFGIVLSVYATIRFPLWDHQIPVCVLSNNSGSGYLTRLRHSTTFPSVSF